LPSFFAFFLLSFEILFTPPVDLDYYESILFSLPSFILVQFSFFLFRTLFQAVIICQREALLLSWYSPRVVSSNDFFF